MRLSSLLLLVGASLVSAQWEFLSRILSPQKPLAAVDEVAIIEKRVRNITSENWRSVINNTAAATEVQDSTDVPEEWFFYFTTSNVNGTKNATFWDGVFDETAILLATSRKFAPEINLGKIDCASIESSELCNNFFLTSQQKLPEFYHIASYANGSVEFRAIPWVVANVTDGEEAAYLVKFHQEGLWKRVDAWKSVFNPIDGLLKEATPYVGMVLGYYEALPPWVVMIVVSLMAKNITNWMKKNPVPRAPPPAAARTS